MYGSINGRRIPDATVPGLVYDVQIYPDTEARTADDEGLTPSQIAAFRRQEWDYVGVVVKAFVNGYEVGEDSLWGLEHGDFVLTDENDNVQGRRWIDLDEMCDGYTESDGTKIPGYPVPDMIEEVRGQIADTIGKTLETLRQALAAIAAEDSPYC